VSGVDITFPRLRQHLWRQIDAPHPRFGEGRKDMREGDTWPWSQLDDATNVGQIEAADLVDQPAAKRCVGAGHTSADEAT
jgi:hypothetical protein